MSDKLLVCLFDLESPIPVQKNSFSDRFGVDVDIVVYTILYRFPIESL